MPGRPKLTLDELIIATAMMDVQLTSRVTGDSEITISTNDGASYVFDVKLVPTVKLTPREM
jgi:hypothetical protein